MSENLTNEQIEIIQQQVIETMNEIDPTKGRLIQIKQGTRSKLLNDSLLIGEPCYITDDKIFVIGTGSGYIEFPNQETFNNYEIKDGSITKEKLAQALIDILDELEASKITVNDSLTSDSSTEALSAKQGKILDEKIKEISENGNAVNVVDTLDSTSTTEALSANQGKILNDTKANKTLANSTTNGLMSSGQYDKLQGIEIGANKTIISDNLTSTTSTIALSANQGRILDEKIKNIIDNPVGTTIVDNLTSTATDEALSANQGKILKDNQDNHSSKKATLTELGHVNHGVINVSLTANWDGTIEPYTQSVNVNGILEFDTPFITPIYSNDNAVAILESNDYNKIDKVQSTDGVLTFTCFKEKPLYPLNLQVKVVR